MFAQTVQPYVKVFFDPRVKKYGYEVWSYDDQYRYYFCEPVYEVYNNALSAGLVWIQQNKRRWE